MSHVQNAPTPTAPLSAVDSAPVTKNKPDEQTMQTVQVGRLSVTVPEDSKVEKKDQKKDSKDDSSLPECFAD